MKLIKMADNYLTIFLFIIFFTIANSDFTANLALENSCKNQSDCTILHSSCNVTSKKCECENDFIELNAECARKAEFMNSCSDDKQCACRNKENCFVNKPYMEQQCSSGKCQCLKEHHYVSEKLLCIATTKSLGGVCEVSDNCKLINNTICSNKTCVCKDKYFEQNKKCLKGIGADCFQTIDCNGNNRVCSKYTCSCTSDMHEVNNFCVKNVLDDVCKDNKDCVNILFGVCLNNRCSCEKNYTKGWNRCFATVETQCNKKEDCKRPDDFSVLEQDDFGLKDLYHDLVCSKQNCSCSEGFHYVKDKFSCVKSAKVLGELCLVDDHCLLSNSNCLNSKCACKEYHYEQDEMCIPGVGADCSKDEQCSASNTKCSKNAKKCVCKARHIYHSLEQCVPVRLFNEQCKVDEQCSCWYEAKCNAAAPYKDLDCSKEKCDCSEGYHFVSNTSSCIRTTKEVGGECANSDNCLFLNNTECKTNKCSCLEHYFVSSNECRQGLNSYCSGDDDCKAVVNSRCQEHTCKCMKYNVPASIGLCVEVSGIGEQCQYDVQCTNMNATCQVSTEDATSGLITCQCGNGQHIRENGCYWIKKLNEDCDSRNECYVEAKSDRVDCRDHKCVCIEGYKRINSTYCDGAGSIGASILLAISLFIFKLVV